MYKHVQHFPICIDFLYDLWLGCTESLIEAFHVHWSASQK